MDVEKYKTDKQNEFFRSYINNPNRINDWKNPRFIKMMELINTLENKNLKIADIGCGLGDFLYLLKLNGYQNIQGFDTSEVAVDFTNKRGFKVNLTKEYLDDINDKFDLIVCGDVLEHILALDIFLNRLRELLNPDGKILISVPNFGCLYNNCLVSLLPDEIANTASFATHSHINHFVLTTLKELLYIHGFSIIQEAGIKLTINIYPGSRRRPIRYLIKITFKMLKYINNIFTSINPSVFSPHLILMTKLVDKPKEYKSSYWP